jgi:hypothetical protein
MDRRVTEDKSIGSRLDGFLLSIEEGRALGGIRNVEASEILRRSEETDSGAHERRLTEYAKESGCWTDLKEIKENLKYLGSGAESDVYLDKDGRYVLKVVNYKASSETPLDFLNNRIALHNTLFPETVYELLGFAYSYEIDEEGFYFITKQPFIDSQKPRPTQEEIDEYMKRKGFLIQDATCIIEEYAITDLAPRNFVKDNEGKLYCIDPMILNMEEYIVKYKKQYENRQ